MSRPHYQILTGDCIESMRALPGESVHCCVTSPPYWGLRDYGNDGQIGLEDTPEAYVARMVDVFREVRRVLRDDGTVWLNLGDCYSGAGYSNHANTGGATRAQGGKQTHQCGSGLKPKNLVGIPWRVAFALQADGWYLRSDIIWHKPNPMPESVTDRPTKAHEYVFLLSKSARYFYDAKAIAEQAQHPDIRHKSTNKSVGAEAAFLGDAPTNLGRCGTGDDGKRNRRSVWTIATRPFSGAHFAVFPPRLIEPCILAGCPVGGTVLDPFGGSGTTACVALQNQRRAILCELNPEYVALARERIDKTTAQASIFDVLAVHQQAPEPAQ